MDIKYELIITERARKELKEIYNYISKSLMEENTDNKLMESKFFTKITKKPVDI